MQNPSPLPGSAFSIVIPAFNEEKAIGMTLRSLKARFPDAEILVVDDGSEDATAAEAQAVPGVRLLRHTTNLGYGASLKTGMRAVTRNVVAWFDADHQHRVEDLEGVLQPVIDGQLDAALGMRGKNSSFVTKRAPGKWLLRWASQIVARRKIPDLNCGLRAFRTSVIHSYLHLLPSGFSASATSTLLMLKRGYRVKFIPIQTRDRIGHSTVRWRDGLRTLKLIFRMMLIFDAFLFFGVLGLLQIIPGLIYSIVIWLQVRQGFPVLGALVIISGILTLALGVLSAQISEMRQERFESQRPPLET